MSHTPGPWTASDPGDYGDYDGNCIVICDEDKRLVVVQGTDDEALANARLIVAAPDLLAALKGWLPIVERQLASLHPAALDSKAFQFALARIERTRSAIARAEGAAP